MPAPLDQLRRHAADAASRAWVPYTEQPRAAVLLLADGTWVPGVRVESASFSLTLGALLNAYTTAVALGRPEVVAAVTSTPLTPEEQTYLAGLPLPSLSLPGPDAALFGTTPNALPDVADRLVPFVTVDIADPADGIRQARAIADGAYVPASQFPVGCLLISADGRAVPGVNVEHDDWGRILCAERNALGTALTYGLTPAALYLSCPNDPTGSPCGACRQLLVEHAASAALWMDRSDAPPEQTTPAALLPNSFDGRSLRAVT